MSTPYAQQPPPSPVPTPPGHAPHPPYTAPPGGGYSSPIPVTRAHLGHALASEWTKIRSVRSTVWTLGIMFMLVVGIGLLTAVGLDSEGDGYIDMPLLAGGLFGLMLGQICVITLGVLVITSEYGTGMIRTTLTACPRRGRVLAAKALVFFLLAFVTTTLACTLTAMIQSSMLGGRTVSPEDPVGEAVRDSIRNGELIATSDEWLDATVGAGLYVALLGLLSLAVGAMLRHSAGAITTMMGAVLLPPILSAFMIGESLEGVRDALLDYSPLNGLATLYGVPMSDEVNASGWPLLGVLAVITAVAVGAAAALINTRDV
ncbi:ABC transporter permease [Streptomyces sp. Z26]|uniref:ABC transporter permease n=1 Tax=Streptomyces TaxID=1883 RepID=UPI001F0C10FB|nr:ABC transporter permease [Streptomyces sp. Z26]